MTDSMAADVRDRLMADASFLEISLTLWPLYKAMAGKMSGETFVFRDREYKVLQVF